LGVVKVLEPFGLDGQGGVVVALLEEVRLERVEVHVVAHRVRDEDTSASSVIASTPQKSSAACNQLFGPGVFPFARSIPDVIKLLIQGVKRFFQMATSSSDKP
jgi:hypothetical protein